MSMANMKVQKPDVPDEARAAPEEADYPPSLLITLEEKQLEALGIQELPTAGQQFSMNTRVTVAATGANPSDRTGKGRSITLQITDLELADEQKPKQQRRRIYTAPIEGNG